MKKRKKYKKIKTSEKAILFRLSYNDFRYIKEFCSAKNLSASELIRDAVIKEIKKVRCKEEGQRQSYYTRLLNKNALKDVFDIVETLENEEKRK